MRNRADADNLQIVRLQEDNGRLREDISTHDHTLERLRAELDALRTEADSKTVDISRLAAEGDNKTGEQSNLRVDEVELARVHKVETENNQVAASDLNRLKDALRGANAEHSDLMVSLQKTQSILSSSQQATDSQAKVLNSLDIDLRNLTATTDA